MATNEVRIIGGKYRGRKLRFTPSAGLRPSLGRVRETMANWLRPILPGARCLDLFAGTGALGLEALSQGAAEVVFVDRARQVSIDIRRNIELLNAPGQVVSGSARDFLRDNEKTWDIVFLDPPYDSDLLLNTLDILANGPHLDQQSLIYFECAKTQIAAIRALSTTWEIDRESKAGTCIFGLLARHLPHS